MTISMESNGMTFDSENPIYANISVNCQHEIPAYGIQVTLMRLDKIRHETSDSEGNTTVHRHKREIVICTYMLHHFANKICPAGETTVFTQIEIPEDAL